MLIALSRFKFGILQLPLTFLDFLIIDRDTFSFLLSVFPQLRMQLIVARLLAVPCCGDLAHRSVSRRAASCAGLPGRHVAADRGDGGRGARAAVGAVPGRQSYFQPCAIGRGGDIAADVDRLDRGRSGRQKAR